MFALAMVVVPTDVRPWVAQHRKALVRHGSTGNRIRLGEAAHRAIMAHRRHVGQG
jgi:hypothetical protein